MTWPRARCSPARRGRRPRPSRRAGRRAAAGTGTRPGGGAHRLAPVRRDFAPASSERLHRAARLAADGAALAFVFDRPRRPVALAEGIDRKHPALLLTVGLHLPRLAALPGVSADPALFLQKVGSLARLAH